MVPVSYSSDDPPMRGRGAALPAKWPQALQGEAVSAAFPVHGRGVFVGFGQLQILAHHWGNVKGNRANQLGREKCNIQHLVLWTYHDTNAPEALPGLAFWCLQV
jgi:hypothetical protein